MDEVISDARDFLQRYNQCGKIIYLSGRKASTSDDVKIWLRNNNFPDGLVLLRPSGNTVQFKTDQLSRLKNEYLLEAHIGDSDDDMMAAENANVPFIFVEPNLWISHDPVEVC